MIEPNENIVTLLMHEAEDDAASTISLHLRSGTSYSVDKILDEWPHAVTIKPEGDHLPSTIVIFKNYIERMQIVRRMKRREVEA